MVVILAGVVAYFRLFTMVNTITTVLWMATRRNGVRRLTVLNSMANGDSATTRFVLLIKLILILPFLY